MEQNGRMEDGAPTLGWNLLEPAGTTTCAVGMLPLGTGGMMNRLHHTYIVWTDIMTSFASAAITTAERTNTPTP